MNLALLLLGPGNLYKSRWYVTAMGVMLTLIGLLIVFDPSDTVTLITLEAFGWVMVIIGLAKIAFALLAGGGRMPSFFSFQGIVFIVLGIAIADFPNQSGNAVPWLFAVALLVNGLYQTLSSLVIRYPNWGWFLASGIAHLVVGGLLFFKWKLVITLVVPIFLGAGLVLMGLTTLRAALRLGRYLKGAKSGDSEMAIRYFLDFHVANRFRKNYMMPEPAAPPEIHQEHDDLLVHVWTPTTVAKSDHDPNIVSRYVAARDKEGKYSVGHSALEMNPDIYISHCDGDPTAFDTGDEVWQTLRSKDAPGEFLPSFEEEIKTYVMPSATIRFRNFNSKQLRTFWTMYRQETRYNFTNRNCSVAVALALEAGLMGSLDTGQKRFRTLFYLLTNKDLWVAHFIRWKAREMIWTPGMMLEYAVALQRVVEE
jgi:uncharacterized membrane protein HdeD (DUF308 family)